MSFSSLFGTGSKKIPDVERRMYSVDSPSSMFHDYSGRGRPIPSGDHALQSDLFVYPTSPNSLTMYDQDGIGGGNPEVCTLSSSIPSTCGEHMSDLGCDEFELKPQFETNIDSLLHFDLEIASPPLPDPVAGTNPGTVNDTGWSTNNTSFLKMEDVFQVEQNDVRGPTLAELNADDSISIFGDIESIITKDLAVMGNVCPSSLSNPVDQPVSPYATCTVTSMTVRPVDAPITIDNNNSNTKFSPKLSPSVYSGFGKLSLISPETKLTPILPATITTAPSVSLQHGFDNSIKNTLQTLLMDGQIKQEKPTVAPSVSLPRAPPCAPPAPTPPAPPPATAVMIKPKISPIPTVSPPIRQTVVQQAPIVSPAGVKRMLSPDQDDYTMDKKWEEIKQLLQDHEVQQDKLLEIGSPPKQQKLDVKDIAYTPQDAESNDEASDVSDAGESDEEHETQFYEENFWSDNESNDSFAEDLTPAGKKDRRFFWQYNTQSKGPKGKRLCKTMQTRDPHVIDEFEDPVFDPDLNQSQYKHNGKARRGDGNDITPNPQKFFQIGNELRKLNRTINNLTPVNELPVNVRSKSRKEKNKLASRACRLKKKAQHEANKVKLHGLNKEHHLLMTVIDGVKEEVFDRLEHKEKSDGELLSAKFDVLVKKHLTHMIAGHTTEYVNSVLSRVAAGDPNGGLN